MNPHHAELVGLIQLRSGQPTQHTFLDGYLGNKNVRYPINTPTLRKIAKDWMKAHPNLSVRDFEKLITHLIRGKSSTEKTIAGIILGYASADQRKFDLWNFDAWLNHLTGWAEVDAVCTGKYTQAEVHANFPSWKKLLTALSKSSTIEKRRASLVMLCSPLSAQSHDGMARLAFVLVGRLRHEKEILITKAISWLLRSMVKHHKRLVNDYVVKNQKSLPAIAVRETMTKVKTGRKNPKR